MNRHAAPLQWLCTLLLILILALSVAACGGYSSPTNPGGGPTPTHNGY